MFHEGQNVLVNGDLYQGDGVVRWYAESYDAATDMDDSVRIRWEQPFPQMSVACGDGKNRHYNGDDISAGKVRPSWLASFHQESAQATSDIVKVTLILARGQGVTALYDGDTLKVSVS